MISESPAENDREKAVKLANLFSENHDEKIFLKSSLVFSYLIFMFQ